MFNFLDFFLRIKNWCEFFLKESMKWHLRFKNAKIYIFLDANDHPPRVSSSSKRATNRLSRSFLFLFFERLSR